jgi:hypothetical protein
VDGLQPVQVHSQGSIMVSRWLGTWDSEWEHMESWTLNIDSSLKHIRTNKSIEHYLGRQMKSITKLDIMGSCCCCIPKPMQVTRLAYSSLAQILYAKKQHKASSCFRGSKIIIQIKTKNAHRSSAVHQYSTKDTLQSFHD